MKYLFTILVLFRLFLISQSLFAQTYQWKGKQISKKEWKEKMNKFVINFEKYYNEDNPNQMESDYALTGMLDAEQAENGLAILVDLKTNSIVSKSAFRKKGQGYIRDTTLFYTPIEPGGLILPMSAAMIMDNYGVTFNDSVDLELGKTQINGRIILDAEQHKRRFTNLKMIIAESSNVGIAKMVNNSFKQHNYELNFKDMINDYVGTAKITPNESIIISQIPFQAFGYSLLLTPNDIFNFYKRVAQSDPTLFKHPETLTQVQTALGEVANNGTAKNLFRDAKYNYAAKTGTVLVEELKKGYAKNQFQSEFIGYDNAEHPRYACMVIIKCKPNSPNHFGATVAGPVFKDIMEAALKN